MKKLMIDESSLDFTYEKNKIASKKFLYENDAWFVRGNKKAELLFHGQEDLERNACYKYISNFNLAIDIGARYGGWLRDLGLKFGRVIAFEPRPKWHKVLPKNVYLHNIDIYPFALGNKDGELNMVGNMVINGPEFKDIVPVKMLDQFGFKNIDFIKIDTDGYEYQVLLGGIETIKYSKPVICMEFVNNENYGGTQAVEFLYNLGYSIKEQNDDDAILIHNGRG